jgi:ATP-dependent protease ClpP protease subunit
MAAAAVAASWGRGTLGGNKRKRMDDAGEEAGCEEAVTPAAHATVYTLGNHVYFNDDVSQQSMFLLARELRVAARRIRMRALESGEGPPAPLYLHVSTYGGDISAAFSVVDTMKHLGVAVFSVVEGYVASAGTLITLAAHKRFIQANAYMMVHQLSSGMWGKMSTLAEEMHNLKKLQDHITDFYLEHTRMRAKQLKRLLLRDVNFNAKESIARGIADELYMPRVG